MKKKFRIRLYHIANLFEMLWSKICIAFGKKYDSSVIPEGVYCYKIDTERNEREKRFFGYHIIPCNYYKTLGNGWNGCKYLGYITDDFVFDDQCKMCDKNEDLDYLDNNNNNNNEINEK